jgi:anion-transporting  ArsA/GET3 family ATPase
MSAEDLFKSRWSRDDLKQIDPELHMALIDQEEMLAEHRAAMQRGWAAALKRMEDAEIEQAKAVFPDAVVRIREK